MYMLHHTIALCELQRHIRTEKLGKFSIFGIKMRVFTFHTFIHSDYVYLHQTRRIDELQQHLNNESDPNSRTGKISTFARYHK